MPAGTARFHGEASIEYDAAFDWYLQRRRGPECEADGFPSWTAAHSQNDCARTPAPPFYSFFVRLAGTISECGKRHLLTNQYTAPVVG